MRTWRITSLGSVPRVEGSTGAYGRLRIHEQLRRDGVTVSKTRVGRLMKANGIQGRVRRRHRVTTDSDHGRPWSPKMLNRDFHPETPDAAWCADITYVPTDSGWVYLTAIIDLGTRMIVGWSMASHMRTELIESALINALSCRLPAVNMRHHSDRGTQYALSRLPRTPGCARGRKQHEPGGNLLGQRGD